jgi:hypothetical protein
MAENKQIGPAIIKAKTVTHNELIMNGNNPKCPESGRQSFEKIILSKDCSINNPDDL